MADQSMKQDIEAVYQLGDGDVRLPQAMDAICGVLSRHPGALEKITNSYRIVASDTEYTLAFALNEGRFSLLDAQVDTDVTVTGKEENLLRVFQRKQSPLSALLSGKIKVKGSKGALLQLAEFL